MADIEIRHSRALIRQIEPRRTLVFVVCVEIEKQASPDGEVEYISTVLPLEEGTVISHGSTPDEAESNALTLFQQMVDHALEADQLGELLGDSDVMQRVNVSMEELVESINSIVERQISGGHRRADRTAARIVPPAWFLAQGSPDDSECAHS
ncbi:MAG: hypothetical protein HYR72_12960 [Deltaproteobacteria bacterium]|nr:hypothetical protein [Deltaproteobacteria bacterium]MBI3390467.1 hypothetical protein [Deltaproteobacteria bacterium]